MERADRFFARAEYDAFSGTFSRSRDQMRWEEVEELVRIFSTRFKGPAAPSILDVGCGSGRLVSVLESFFGNVGFRYLGTDLSSGMLSEARKRHPDLRFEKRDMRDLSGFPIQGGPTERRFDAVFAIASFHHLLTEDDRSRALSQFRKVLLPGGTFAMTCWNLLSKPNLTKYASFRNGDGVFEIPLGKNVRRYAGLEKDAILKELVRTGFRVVSSGSNDRNFWVAAISD